MDDKLELVLNRVIDWLKYEDAKNAALITLDGVGLGVLLQWLSVSKLPAVLCHWLHGSLAALLLSLLLALSSVYPVLKAGRLHAYMAQRRKHRLNKKTDWKPNILFFADIAGQEAKEYLKDFQAASGKDDNGTDLDFAYAKQIVANAEIALLKLRIFEAAFAVSFLGFVVACGVAVANFIALSP